MLGRFISGCFYVLFFATPLFFTSLNHELFEYNKMMLVYFLTIVISGLWLIKMIWQRKLLVNRTPFDIPILLFLGANILSTLTSIDQHTSLWGYYTRSNGGLLSILSYTTLFYAFVSNIEPKKVYSFLKAAILGGVFVALYAIPEHFGISPSCVILYNQWDANCWVQDVASRVFATLGQPNWLAAYLAMMIFPALYFYILAKQKRERFYYFICLILYYLAFTFTYSRGATLGLIGGFLAFLVLQFGRKIFAERKAIHSKIFQKFPELKSVLVVLISFLIVNLLFASALTSFKLIKQSAPPPRPSLVPTTPITTQLENGGTESGQIRLIVWQGAIDIFKAYPLFGSGVETFAYSYYQFRPVKHNLVSEWDFLYNKAHNEYLNYLANTGLVGFISYMALILMFIGWSILRIFNFQFSISNNNFKIQIINLEVSQNIRDSLLIVALLSAYISYLIQNIFGFSVVIIALFFYMFPAIGILATESIRKIELINSPLALLSRVFSKTLNRQRIFGKVLSISAVICVVIITLNYGLIIIRYWIADTKFARGANYSDIGNPGQAYNYIKDAIYLNPDEPLFRIELGYAGASAALALVDEDASLSAKLKDEAISETNSVLSRYPKNISFFRTAIRTFYELSSLDPKFSDETIQIFDKAIALAPSDAKLYYNKGLVLGQLGKNKEGIESVQKAIQLKPNYRDAYFGLAILYHDDKQIDQATRTMEELLKLVPNDPDAKSKLEEWKLEN